MASNEEEFYDKAFRRTRKELGDDISTVKIAFGRVGTPFLAARYLYREGIKPAFVRGPTFAGIDLRAAKRAVQPKSALKLSSGVGFRLLPLVALVGAEKRSRAKTDEKRYTDYGVQLGLGTAGDHLAKDYVRKHVGSWAKPASMGGLKGPISHLSGGGSVKGTITRAAGSVLARPMTLLRRAGTGAVADYATTKTYGELFRTQAGSGALANILEGVGYVKDADKTQKYIQDFASIASDEGSLEAATAGVTAMADTIGDIRSTNVERGRQVDNYDFIEGATHDATPVVKLVGSKASQALGFDSPEDNVVTDTVTKAASDAKFVADTFKEHLTTDSEEDDSIISKAGDTVSGSLAGGAANVAGSIVFGGSVLGRSAKLGGKYLTGKLRNLL